MRAVRPEAAKYRRPCKPSRLGPRSGDTVRLCPRSQDVVSRTCGKRTQGRSTASGNGWPCGGHKGEGEAIHTISSSPTLSAVARSSCDNDGKVDPSLLNPISEGGVAFDKGVRHASVGRASQNAAEPNGRIEAKSCGEPMRIWAARFAPSTASINSSWAAKNAAGVGQDDLSSSSEVEPRPRLPGSRVPRSSCRRASFAG